MDATKRLLQIDENVFLNVNALVFVRFEDMHQDATAILKFDDRGTESVSGEAARNLHGHLTRFYGGSDQADQISLDQQDYDSHQEQSDPGVASQGGSVREEGPPAPVHSKPMSFVLDASTMFLGRNKAWFYRKGDDGRGLILAFVNAKGSCSVRPFDSDTGMALSKRYGSGPYEHHFADLIEGSVPLSVGVQPNLERDCKVRLPDNLFKDLRGQIRQRS